ncbi:MAG TPA: zinc ribbon domain-containing protein [Anaerolineales bacterium]|nr:zinc ribbon domain-containing protein [Anaerolineales bacterium]
MRKWLALFMLGMFLAFPFSVSAQSENHLTSLNIQLWPEYDKPSMLVICDFQLPADTPLPTKVSFRIPNHANVIAVASNQPSGLMEAAYDGPVQNGDWSILTVNVESKAVYHFEYYQPLTISGVNREFQYVWPGDFAVDQFTIRVQQPVDTVSLSTVPQLTPTQDSDGLTYYTNQPMPLEAGTPYTLNLKYKKTSNALTAPTPQIQPSQPLGPDTAGRVSLNNYLPYVAGGVGVLLIASGLIYYYLVNRSQSPGPRRRRNNQSETSESQVYCHQCGQRARVGDRFCRVCGTRLRQEG